MMQEIRAYHLTLMPLHDIWDSEIVTFFFSQVFVSLKLIECELHTIK